MTAIPTDLTTAELDALDKARGELALQLTEADDGAASGIEAELERVESEIEGRRRAVERDAASERARHQREIDARAAAEAERIRQGRAKLKELAPKRTAAAKKVDDALASLAAACRQWQAVALEQHSAAWNTGLDGHAWGATTVIAPRISHELRQVFPHGPFQHWSFDGNAKSFVELDAPYGDIVMLEEEEAELDALYGDSSRPDDDQ